ncbi:MAG: hypothetical protein H0W85_00730 [Methylotenera sp.]|nr:hypothetical protein [Methylotenera sp.]
MGLTSGYLVTYNRNDEALATLYDEYLNYINELEPDSQEVLDHVENAQEVTNLQDEMWEEVLGELTLQERLDGLAYRLENEALTEEDEQIEEAMDLNEDEMNVGYNG